jgi:hypothetical protein
MRIVTPLLFCSALLAADPALTIYNQNFAVIRETIPLDLQQGATSVRFVGTTAHLEPASVILRDPTGRRNLQILEQSYRADPVSAEMLLSLFEGQTIDFLVTNRDTTQIISGKIIRSGYKPGPQVPYRPPSPDQPIIEVDGKLRFQLPGAPLFPKLADDTILKPTIEWTIQSDVAGKFDAELGYVSGALSWEADYNIISPLNGDALDVIGWVTMANQSGKTFENARIKLMAGDVNKIRPAEAYMMQSAGLVGGMGGAMQGQPPVTEKTFDEYHLYTLQRPATLHDRETKQVEFVRAAGVKSKIIYIYDGAKIDPNRYRGWPAENIRNDSGYGTESNPKVWVMREFQNSDANHLGMPLPRGRVGFYRRDADGRLEFTGEDTIDHTPHDETIRTFTGAAFDLVGERRRVTYRIDHQRSMLDESFEIKVRNHKKEAAEVRAVEHLYRGTTWEIPASSSSFTKKDSQTVEFQVPLAADEEKTLTYSAHYTW